MKAENKKDVGVNPSKKLSYQYQLYHIPYSSIRGSVKIV